MRFLIYTCEYRVHTTNWLMILFNIDWDWGRETLPDCPESKLNNDKFKCDDFYLNFEAYTIYFIDRDSFSFRDDKELKNDTRRLTGPKNRSPLFLDYYYFLLIELKQRNETNTRSSQCDSKRLKIFYLEKVKKKN